MTFFDDLFERFVWLHDEYKKTISGLSVAALDWVPGQDMNTLCVLVVHVAAAERFWVGDVGMGEASGRNRAAEFAAQGMSEAALNTRLDASLAYLEDALGRLSLADLAAPRPLPPNMNPGRADTRPYSLAWALLHGLEHTALHLGHAHITRQLWDARA